jgi:hypothetical protein
MGLPSAPLDFRYADLRTTCTCLEGEKFGYGLLRSWMPSSAKVWPLRRSWRRGIRAWGRRRTWNADGVDPTDELVIANARIKALERRLSDCRQIGWQQQDLIERLMQENHKLRESDPS